MHRIRVFVTAGAGAVALVVGASAGATMLDSGIASAAPGSLTATDSSSIANADASAVGALIVSPDATYITGVVNVRGTGCNAGSTAVLTTSSPVPSDANRVAEPVVGPDGSFTDTVTITPGMVADGAVTLFATCKAPSGDLVLSATVKTIG